MAHADRNKYVVIGDAQNDAQEGQEIGSQKKVLAAFSANNPIYLVTVEDPSTKSKKRAFVTTRLDKDALGLKFIGYEVKYSDKEAIKTHADAFDSAINRDDPFDIFYPGHRLISVRQVSYKHKNN